jgi:hypothetical protein
MEGSQVTTIVSVVGGVVGLIALSVAWSQMRIATAKTKLDLYNKRFNVYLAALEFYQCAYSDSPKDIKEKANKLAHSYRESRFLFDMRDGLHETLGRIQKGSGVIVIYEGFKQSPDIFERSKATVMLKDKYSAALSEMGKDLLILEDQLKKYLSFHNVRGWTVY